MFPLRVLIFSSCDASVNGGVRGNLRHGVNSEKLCAHGTNAHCRCPQHCAEANGPVDVLVARLRLNSFDAHVVLDDLALLPRIVDQGSRDHGPDHRNASRGSCGQCCYGCARRCRGQSSGIVLPFQLKLFSIQFATEGIELVEPKTTRRSHRDQIRRLVGGCGVANAMMMTRDRDTGMTYKPVARWVVLVC